MKKVSDSLKEKGESDDKIKEFQKGAQNAAKKILGSFKDYDIYCGESSYGADGNILVLVNFREDGITPFATLWKHGLEEYKV